MAKKNVAENFDFSKIEAAPEKKTKKSDIPVAMLPKDFAEGVTDRKRIKELDAEISALKKKESYTSLVSYVMNHWVSEGIKGVIHSTIDFVCGTVGKIRFTMPNQWSKVNIEKAEEFKVLLGEDNFNQVMNVKTEMVGDLATVQENFNKWIKEQKIDMTIAKKVFSFLTTNFKQETTFSFSEDFTYAELFKLAGNDTEKVNFLISNLAYNKNGKVSYQDK